MNNDKAHTVCPRCNGTRMVEVGCPGGECCSVKATPTGLLLEEGLPAPIKHMDDCPVCSTPTQPAEGPYKVVLVKGMATIVGPEMPKEGEGTFFDAVFIAQTKADDFNMAYWLGHAQGALAERAKGEALLDEAMRLLVKATHNQTALDANWYKNFNALRERRSK
ncbi:MAG: hypothetical protein KGL39_19730 [Patescibacteria group bacterium]|nr:hypothetical protein [Patescibacteria group bacterium]